MARTAPPAKDLAAREDCRVSLRLPTGLGQDPAPLGTEAGDAVGDVCDMGLEVFAEEGSIAVETLHPHRNQRGPGCGAGLADRGGLFRIHEADGGDSSACLEPISGMSRPPPCVPLRHAQSLLR